MDQYTSMDGFVIIHNNEVVMKCSYNNENYFNHYRFNIMKGSDRLKHISFSIHDIIFTDVVTGFEIKKDKLFLKIESIKKGCYNTNIYEVRDETNYSVQDDN